MLRKDEMGETREKIVSAVNYIQAKIGSFKPAIAIVLGSGLGDLAEKISASVKIKYEDIPGFPVSTIEGHAGRLIAGVLEGKNVIVMQGRFHYYEGYALQDVTLPIRVFRKLGVDKLIVTNAAGGVNRKFTPGDLMIIKDHINFTGLNPLRGRNFEEFGLRFPDLSFGYDPDLILTAKQAAKEKSIDVKEGVYFFSSGPSYETPAEIRALQITGADAVGMSTVPEVVVAVHSGMKVLGISCITNMAAGILPQKLTHHEVMDTTEKVKEKFIALLRETLKKL